MSGGFVQIDTTEIEKKFDFLTVEMDTAAKRAAIRTREWLRTQVTREIASTTGVPRKALKERVRRGSKENDGAWYSDGQAVLWIGLQDIPAHYLGKPRQTKKGVRVRKHFFDKAFTVSIGEQAPKVWKRAGKSRLPIIKMTVPVEPGRRDLLGKYEKAAARMFSERLEHEINYLLEQRA
jgi:hypothetical protein